MYQLSFGSELICFIEWFIDVEDVSLLHIGALVLSGVKSERLFGCAGRYTVNDFLRIFRTLYPDRGIMHDVDNVPHDLRKVPNERSADVLKKMGVPGWKCLEDCIGQLTHQFAKVSQ